MSNLTIDLLFLPNCFNDFDFANPLDFYLDFDFDFENDLFCGIIFLSDLSSLCFFGNRC